MKEVLTRSLEDPITALAIHSSSSIILGDIEGSIHVLSGDSYSKSTSIKIHKKSLRSLVLNDDSAISASSSGHLAITDLSNLEIIRRLKLPKKTAASQISLVAPHIIAHGDDDGYLTIIDIRKAEKGGLIRRAALFDDYISSIISFPSVPNHLLISSGDGSVCFYDYGTGKTVAKCEGLEDEITCATKLDEIGSRILYLTATGAVNIFKYDYWGQPDDRILLNDGISCCSSGENGAAYVSLFNGEIFKFVNYSMEKIYNMDGDINCLAFDSSSNRLLASVDKNLILLEKSGSTDRGNFFQNID